MVKDALVIYNAPLYETHLLSSGLTHKGSLREAGKIKETITYYTLQITLYIVFGMLNSDKMCSLREMRKGV